MRRQCLAGAGETVPPTEMIIDNIAAYAVGGSDDIGWLPIRQGGAEAGQQAVIGQCDRDAGGAALPDTHQPDAIESKIGYLRPSSDREQTQDRWPFPRAADASSHGQVLIS